MSNLLRFGLPTWKGKAMRGSFERRWITLIVRHETKVIGRRLSVVVIEDEVRIPRDREQRFHGMVNTESTAT